MKIRFEDMLKLLETNPQGATETEVSPAEALLLDFRVQASPEEWKDAIAYETVSGGRFLIELDEEGHALAIEFE